MRIVSQTRRPSDAFRWVQVNKNKCCNVCVCVCAPRHVCMKNRRSISNGIIRCHVCYTKAIFAVKWSTRFNIKNINKICCSHKIFVRYSVYFVFAHEQNEYVPFEIRFCEFCISCNQTRISISISFQVFFSLFFYFWVHIIMSWLPAISHCMQIHTDSSSLCEWTTDHFQNAIILLTKQQWWSISKCSIQIIVIFKW